jgi:4-carboxymuconolactone decarboxylase
MKSSNQRIVSLPVKSMHQDWINTISKLPGEGLKGHFAPVNVLGVLMNSPQNFGSFLEYWVSSKHEMKLTAREQELIILRVGCLYQCDYVWGHHVPPALESGLSRVEIEQIKQESDLSEWSDRESVLLIATDELVDLKNISEDTWSKLLHHLDSHQAVDLIMLVTQYIFFALVNNSFRVELEDGIESISGS